MQKRIFISAFLALLWGLQAFAADGSTGPGRFDFRAKSENKRSSRWTLEDWMAQKERNQIMDLWLAMYSPSPYEFFLEGVFQSYTTSTDPASEGRHVSSGRGSAGAYATILGVEGYYENNVTEKFNESALSLNLRVIGNAVQGTHLILLYGLRSLQADSNGAVTGCNQLFAGADLNLYLNRHVGLSGRYQAYLPTDAGGDAGQSDGHRTEAGLFMDFSAVRVFGGWFQDTNRVQNGGTQAETVRTGMQSGIKFFF